MFKFDLTQRPIFWNAETEEGAGGVEETSAPETASVDTSDAGAGKESTYAESATTGSDSAGSPKETAEEETLFDIEELISDSDDDAALELPAVEDQKEPAKTEPQTAPEVPKETVKEVEPEPQPAPQAQTQETQTGNVEQQQPKPEPQPAQEVQPQQPQLTPEQRQANYQQFFNKSVDTLAEHVYKFDEQTAEALDTEPSKALPRLAAQLHMQVLTAAVTQTANLVPNLIAQYQQNQSGVEAIENKFYGEYKDLNDHRQTVDNIARLYRQLNPTKSFEDAAPEIAAMARVQLRLPVPGQVQMQQTQPQPQVQQPVVPSSARGGQAAAAPIAQPTEWEELIQEEN